MKKIELVDVLNPPTFERSGVTKTRERAYNDNDWLATFNLWIVQTDPNPAIIFQKRSRNQTIVPSLLDVAVGGHYSTGESMLDGLRESKEEVGKIYDKENIISLGRRMYIDYDISRNLRHNIVYVFATIDNSQLSTFKLQKDEVEGIFACPVEKIVKVFSEKDFSFTVNGLDNEGKEIETLVKQSSFPYNWDNYFYKMAVLIKRMLKGEKELFI